MVALKIPQKRNTAMKKKILRAAAVVLGSIVLLWLILFLLPRQQNFESENPMRRDGALPILIAHGGGNGEFPDNTLEAFYNAYSVDPRVMMETDVSITKDGIVILGAGSPSFLFSYSPSLRKCDFHLLSPNPTSQE